MAAGYATDIHGTLFAWLSKAPTWAPCVLSLPARDWCGVLELLIVSDFFSFLFFLLFFFLREPVKPSNFPWFIYIYLFIQPLRFNPLKRIYS